MDGEAVEAVRNHRAGWTARCIVGPEHEVVDKKLRTPTKEVGQRSAAFVGLEAISLVNGHPREFLPLAGQLVAAMRELLLRLEQLDSCFQPLFACTRFACGHCLFRFLVSFIVACEIYLSAPRYAPFAGLAGTNAENSRSRAFSQPLRQPAATDRGAGSGK